jgi:colicin import membrane protein
MNLLREILSSMMEGVRVLTSEPRHLFYAVLVHVGFFSLFVLNFDWTKTVRPEPPGEVVQAVLVDETQVQREIDRLKETEARKAAEEAESLRRQREAEQARKREEQRLAELKQQQERTARQAEEQRKREEQAAKQAAEQRKQEDQAARQAAEQRKQEEQRLAELKKQEEEARKREEQRQAEERKRQEEARKREEEKRKQEAEEARRLAEEKRLRDEQAAAERARREQTEVERYLSMIRQQVMRSWIKPPNWQKGQQCVLRVNLIPGGDVVAVAVVRSCGDALANRSVEDAVWRAAPLQVPSADSGLFDRFRELEFLFNPES